MSDMKIALAKGRLADQSIELLGRAGRDVAALANDSGRKLILESGGYEYFMVKPADVPVYVERGVADIGICGKDTLLESGCTLYEMMDLKFGACRLCLAGYPEEDPHRAGLKVATKYSRITRDYYGRLGESVEIIRLTGSVELAPMLGLSDIIFDVVETGRTLRDNGLVVLEEAMRISARLCVNKVSLKTKATRIKELMGDISLALEV